MNACPLQTISIRKQLFLMHLTADHDSSNTNSYFGHLHNCFKGLCQRAVFFLLENAILIWMAW